MKQKTSEAMRPILEAYAHYQGSKRAFCAKHGLAAHTLDYWRRKFRGSEAEPSGFIAVEVAGGSSSPTIELHYPNGVRATVSVDLPVEVLQNLITLGG
ncbi:MAG: hypothetical protein H6566_18415 [Lewinellaceae bacterium]|nr:hypothetical protein [Lewinellaceae bacterium]